MKPAGRGGVENGDGYDQIAVNIRNRRLTLGLTQQELADRLGWMQSRIAQFEMGGQDRRWSTIERLAVGLETTPAELISSPANATQAKPKTKQKKRKRTKAGSR